MLQKKICMVGVSGTGKTCMVQRFVHSIFSVKYLSTVGVKIDRKEVQSGGQPMMLMLWDLEGRDGTRDISQLPSRRSRADLRRGRHAACLKFATSWCRNWATSRPSSHSTRPTSPTSGSSSRPTSRPSVAVSHTSLPPAALEHRFGTAGGQLFAVADGVGGRPEGDVASERAISALLNYVGRAAECFHGLDTNREHEILGKLEQTVHEVHDGLVKEYSGVTSKLPATTLTMLLLIWPRAYLVHVGDSRAYVRRRGRLQRLTRDQNMGEYMVSRGAWTDEQSARASTSATLSSAVGGSDIEPVVGLVDLEPGDSLLLCTDGLNKHVTDDQIAAALEQPTDAATTCRQLVNEALAGGGTDNVTVVVVRTAPA